MYICMQIELYQFKSWFLTNYSYHLEVGKKICKIFLGGKFHILQQFKYNNYLFVKFIPTTPYSSIQ